jgi:hypothetical protein
MQKKPSHKLFYLSTIFVLFLSSIPSNIIWAQDLLQTVPTAPFTITPITPGVPSATINRTPSVTGSLSQTISTKNPTITIAPTRIRITNTRLPTKTYIYTKTPVLMPTLTPRLPSPTSNNPLSGVPVPMVILVAVIGFIIFLVIGVGVWLILAGRSS